MKLYDGGRAPNPRRVRIFLAEKGITVPTEQVNLGALEQRSEAYTAINPMQRVPALVLDDGTRCIGSCCERVPASASGHEPDGRPAGAGLGRGE